MNNQPKTLAIIETPYLFDRKYYYDIAQFELTPSGRLKIVKRVKLHREANLREEIINNFGVNYKLVNGGGK